MSTLPDTWTLTASAFNWTPEVVRAERSAADIAVGIVRDGVAPAIEIEAGRSSAASRSRPRRSSTASATTSPPPEAA